MIELFLLRSSIRDSWGPLSLG